MQVISCVNITHVTLILYEYYYLNFILLGGGGSPPPPPPYASDSEMTDDDRNGHRRPQRPVSNIWAPFHKGLRLIASFLNARFAIELRLISIVRLIVTLCETGHRSAGGCFVYVFLKTEKGSKWYVTSCSSILVGQRFSLLHRTHFCRPKWQWRTGQPGIWAMPGGPMPK